MISRVISYLPKFNKPRGTIKFKFLFKCSCLVRVKLLQLAQFFIFYPFGSLNCWGALDLALMWICLICQNMVDDFTSRSNLHLLAVTFSLSCIAAVEILNEKLLSLLPNKEGERGLALLKLGCIKALSSYPACMNMMVKLPVFNLASTFSRSVLIKSLLIA